MNPFLEGVDDLRKAKIMEFHEKAEIKARQRPAKSGPAARGRAPAPAASNAASSSSAAPARPGMMRPPASAAKTAPAPLKRPTSTISVDKDIPESPKRTSSIARPGVKPPGSIAAPTSRIAARQSIALSTRTASPPPPAAAPVRKSVDEPPVAAPKLGRGLLGRVQILLEYG